MKRFSVRSTGNWCEGIGWEIISLKTGNTFKRSSGFYLDRAEAIEAGLLWADGHGMNLEEFIETLQGNKVRDE